MFEFKGKKHEHKDDSPFKVSDSEEQGLLSNRGEGFGGSEGVCVAPDLLSDIILSWWKCDIETVTIAMQ